MGLWQLSAAFSDSGMCQPAKPLACRQAKKKTPLTW